MKLTLNLASIMYDKPVSRSTLQVFFQVIFERNIFKVIVESM